MQGKLNKRQKITNQNSGFTLVELIIAIAIFSIIAISSYSALSNFTNNTKTYNENSDEIIKLQRFSIIVGRDFSQITNKILGMDANVIEFDSVQNDKILNIKYYFNNNRIIREVNEYKVIILDNLENLKVRILDNNGKWHTKWKKENTESYITSIEVKFDHKKYGEIIKLAIINE